MPVLAEFARSAGALRMDLRLTANELLRLVESHIGYAIRRQKSAAERGLFKDVDQREQANKDPDLAILAGRREFREIREGPQTKH